MPSDKQFSLVKHSTSSSTKQCCISVDERFKLKCNNLQTLFDDQMNKHLNLQDTELRLFKNHTICISTTGILTFMEKSQYVFNRKCLQYGGTLFLSGGLECFIYKCTLYNVC